MGQSQTYSTRVHSIGQDTSQPSAPVLKTRIVEDRKVYDAVRVNGTHGNTQFTGIPLPFWIAALALVFLVAVSYNQGRSKLGEEKERTQYTDLFTEIS